MCRLLLPCPSGFTRLSSLGAKGRKLLIEAEMSLQTPFKASSNAISLRAKLLNPKLRLKDNELKAVLVN